MAGKALMLAHCFNPSPAPPVSGGKRALGSAGYDVITSQEPEQGKVMALSLKACRRS